MPTSSEKRATRRSGAAFLDVGLVGRKTGVKLNRTVLKDDDEMDNVDDFFVVTGDEKYDRSKSNSERNYMYFTGAEEPKIATPKASVKTAEKNKKDSGRLRRSRSSSEIEVSDSKVEKEYEGEVRNAWWKESEAVDSTETIERAESPLVNNYEADLDADIDAQAFFRFDALDDSNVNAPGKTSVATAETTQAELPEESRTGSLKATPLSKKREKSWTPKPSESRRKANEDAIPESEDTGSPVKTTKRQGKRSKQVIEDQQSDVDKADENEGGKQRRGRSTSRHLNDDDNTCEESTDKPKPTKKKRGRTDKEDEKDDTGASAKSSKRKPLKRKTISEKSYEESEPEVDLGNVYEIPVTLEKGKSAKQKSKKSSKIGEIGSKSPGSPISNRRGRKRTVKGYEEIVHDEHNESEVGPPGGVRKSMRTKRKPLAYWRCERLVTDLQGVKSVVTVPEDENCLDAALKGSKRKRARKPRASKAKPSKKGSEDEDNSDEDLSSDEKPLTASNFPQMNGIIIPELPDVGLLKKHQYAKIDKLEVQTHDEDGNELSKCTVFTTIDTCKGKVRGDVEVGRSFGLKDVFSSGVLYLKPDGCKQMQNTKSQWLLLFPIDGVCSVTAEEETFTVASGCHVRIPPFTNYSIQNLSEDVEARFHFCGIKE
eukprot:Nk52_evm18s2011 gene=Nk52_evmTU18s2011